MISCIRSVFENGVIGDERLNAIDDGENNNDNGSNDISVEFVWREKSDNGILSKFESQFGSNTLEDISK